MKSKLFICGGHVTPAIALIDEFSRDDAIEIVFVGRKYAVEYRLITQKGIRFLPLTAGKSSWSSLAKIPLGFIQAFVYCMREKPALVVSFGGYVALPVAIAAWILRIPVITHEQTLVPGLANKIIAHIARRICVAFEETIPLFAREKVVFTGLPMRKEFFVPVPISQKRPLIYITGGSQGAKSLNEKIFPAIAVLTKDYTIIHQTGPVSFPSSDHYVVERFIPVDALSAILHRAMIVIGRSGANTTLELAALGKVAILVPLPWSAGNEQLLQAKWLAARGGAQVLEQSSLSVETLVDYIKKIRNNYGSLQKRAEAFARTIPRDGAARLAKEIRTLLTAHA